MPVASSANAPRATRIAPDRPRDDRGRIASLETIALQGLDAKHVDDDTVEGKAWARGQIRLLMRIACKLTSVAIPSSLERLLLYEKVMMSHLERGMLLFGLGKHAGKNVLILCTDSATAEKLAKRAPALASVDAGQPAQVTQAQVAPNVDLHLSAQVATVTQAQVDAMPAQVDVSTKPTPQVAQATTAQACVYLHQVT